MVLRLFYVYVILFFWNEIFWFVGYNTNEIINENVIIFQNGIHEWSKNFIIGGSVYIGSGLIFILLGTSEIQPWNEKLVEKDSEEAVTYKEVNSKDEQENESEPNESTKLSG